MEINSNSQHHHLSQTKLFITKPFIIINFANWGEAIARALGYKEYEFLKACYNNIGFQNNEVIESTPLAFAIKKLVEQRQQSLETIVIFEGTPIELLEKLNDIAINKKNTDDRAWPKDRKWVVKRLNIIKSNLQRVLESKYVLIEIQKVILP